jgi:hypothetical protein
MSAKRIRVMVLRAQNANIFLQKRVSDDLVCRALMNDGLYSLVLKCAVLERAIWFIPTIASTRGLL